MAGPELRLRLALIAWAQGMDLTSISTTTRDWEPRLAVEQFSRHTPRRPDVNQPNKERDEKKILRDGLRELRKTAALISPPNPDPRSSIHDDLYGPQELSPMEEEHLRIPYATWEETQTWFGRTWTVRPPNVPYTAIEQVLLEQGWHLVAPGLVLGWMVARPLVGDTKGVAKKRGEKYLGLKAGFQAANRANYYLKLSRGTRDLATLTLQRNALRALAELEVVPPTITDVGVPIQTLLLGTHDGADCCVLISGGHLYVWYREETRWDREPRAHASLHARDFSMATVGDDAVAFHNPPEDVLEPPFTLTDLRLHTFGLEPWRFPAAAWHRRTGLDVRYFLPTRFLDERGDRRRLL